MNNKVNLFFLPHAGGSAMGYMSFKRFLDNSLINPIPLELPGRGKLIKEKPINNTAECVDFLFNSIKDIISDSNYAFFGHSLGSILTYELIKLIEKEKMPSPITSIFSGRMAPFISYEHTLISHLDDESFISNFSSLNGIPEEIMNNKQILQMIMPVLKSDVKMAEDYVCQSKDDKFDFNIHVFYGNKDTMIKNRKDLIDWNLCTTKKCTLHEFDGDHFYYNQNKEHVCSFINNIMNEEVLNGK